jgi:MFS family permease
MTLPKIYRMYVLSFFFTLHVALSAYANSTFLTTVMPEKYVGMVYTLASLIALILLTRSAHLLQYFGNKKLILWLLLVNMLALVGLITIKSPLAIVASLISFLATNTLISLCLDIFIEHFGDKATVGKTRGFYLTVTNSAWMLSPLITAFLITREGGYQTIYLVAFMATIIMTLGLLLSVKTFTDAAYKKTPFIETYQYLKTNSHMFSISMMNFILQFFFSWMVVYTPIYLIQHMGFNWSALGVIFTVMLAPFVLFGFPVGVLIDKYHIKKRTLLYIGISIMALSTASITFITSHEVIVWSLVLFLTRMGASIVESATEIYFFTHITEEEAYVLGFFRDMTPVAYIVAPLIATTLFLFFPFKYLFIALAGIVLFGGFYYIKKLKHNHEYYLPNQN